MLPEIKVTQTITHAEEGGQPATIVETKATGLDERIEALRESRARVEALRADFEAAGPAAALDCAARLESTAPAGAAAALLTFVAGGVVGAALAALLGRRPASA